MAIINVSNSSELKAALLSVKGGDTISLASGNYGDFTIRGKDFLTDVKFVSGDAGNPATFHSLTIADSSHLHFDNIDVNLVPTMTTFAHSSAVLITDSQNVTLSNGKILGGNAINGVAQDATALDSTGNVKGLPTGIGVNIQKSSGVTVDNMDISHLTRGVGMGRSDHVTVTNNEIYELRKTGIFGGAVSDVVVDGNHIHDSNPWKWGETPLGDHADFIAFWTDPQMQTGASANISVTNNLMEQGDGTAILGMWFQGQQAAGFENVAVEGNTILNGNFQGITLKWVSGGSIADNTLLQTDGTLKTAPSILLYDNAKNIKVSGNDAGSVHDLSNSTSNQFVDNDIVQRFDPSASGYYSVDLINKLSQLDGYGVLPGVSLPGESGGVAGRPDTGAGSDLGVALPGGTSGADNLVGTKGADVLNGGASDDTLSGGAGADTLTGGGGADTFVYKPYDGKDVITDFGAGGHDFLDLSAMTASKLKPVFQDVDNGTTIRFATGDVITLLDVKAKDLVAVKGGYTTNATKPAPEEAPSNGGPLAGNDTILGTARADVINGGGGNDFIDGGAGADTLTGGAGADTFVYRPYAGRDVITDFGVGGHDFLDLSAMTASKLKPWLVDIDHGTTVNFATGDVITLMGVAAKDLIAVAGGFTI